MKRDGERCEETKRFGIAINSKRYHKKMLRQKKLNKRANEQPTVVIYTAHEIIAKPLSNDMQLRCINVPILQYFYSH